jgi:hypothetical protein
MTGSRAVWKFEEDRKNVAMLELSHAFSTHVRTGSVQTFQQTLSKKTS